MTLNQIFDKIQYGEEYAKQKALKEAVMRDYDDELALFYGSKRVRELSGNVVLSETEESKINRVASKMAVVEDRLEAGKLMSEAYKKMQGTAILEDCKSIMEDVTKTRKIDSKKAEVLGKIVGTAKYFVNSCLDNNAVLSESTNPLLNKTIKEESEMISKCFTENE